MLKVSFHISSVESLGVYHLLSVQSFPEGGAEFSMRRYDPSALCVRYCAG